MVGKLVVVAPVAWQAHPLGKAIRDTQAHVRRHRGARDTQRTGDVVERQRAMRDEQKPGDPSTDAWQPILLKVRAVTLDECLYLWRKVLAVRHIPSGRVGWKQGPCSREPL